MCKADIPLCIDDTIQRHSTQLEKIHFLPVRSGHGMFRVRQPDKRDLFILPILLKDDRRIGSDSQDFRAAAPELFIFIS